jgi:hypothetical protein
VRDTPENKRAIDAFLYQMLADQVLEVMESNDFGKDRDLCLEILNLHSGQKWKKMQNFKGTIVLETWGPNAPGNPVGEIPNFTASINETLGLFRTGITAHLRPVMRQYPDEQWCVTFDFGTPMLNAPRVYGDDLARTVLIAGLLSAAFILDGGKIWP